MLAIVRNVYAVEPGLSSRLFVIEEKDVCRNACVGAEHAARQADDCMKVKICKKLFLKIVLCVVVSKEEAVWNDYSGASIFFKAVHDDGHEQIGGFAGAQVCREILLDVVLFASAVWWIHKNYIKGIFLSVVQKFIDK